MSNIGLYVSVPVCSLRKAHAREYLETERIPPPATAYGFLLSLVGEEDRTVYLGTRLAIGRLYEPEISTVLRTMWRVKDKKLAPGTGNNKRPDYQEILTGLKIAVWVEEGALAEKLGDLREDPGRVERFGGLSLGESRDLVDEVCFDSPWLRSEAEWLTIDAKGRYALPIWVDHIGSKDTVWGQFALETASCDCPVSEDARWITILPEK